MNAKNLKCFLSSIPAVTEIMDLKNISLKAVAPSPL
jgi:hypothetical protein